MLAIIQVFAYPYSVIFT